MLTAVLLASLMASAAVSVAGPHYYAYPWYYPGGLQRALVVVNSPQGVPVVYPHPYPVPYPPAGLQKGSYVTAEGPGGSTVLHEGVAYQVGDQFKQR